MTGYSGIILFAVSLYSAIVFYRFFSAGNRLLHFYYGTAAVFMAIIGISGYLAVFFPILNPDFIDDWATVFGVSFILSAASALIRELKPEFTRYPKLFTLLPLILIVIYPLIMNTLVLKTWVVSIYQGSAILIGLLIFGYKTSKNSRYGYLLVAVIFFMVTSILFWLPVTIFSLPEQVWILLTSCGVLIFTVGYNQVREEEHSLYHRHEDDKKWFL